MEGEEGGGRGKGRRGKVHVERRGVERTWIGPQRKGSVGRKCGGRWLREGAAGGAECQR